MSIWEIIDELKRLDQEIQDLKRDKAQVEMFCAAIVKNYSGEITLNYDDFYKSDYEKVRLYPVTDDNMIVNIKYIEK